jgi:hypothetical protein
MSEKEVTIKEIIGRVKDVVAMLWLRKFWLLGIGLTFGLIFGFKAYLSKATYSTSISFMVNDDEGGGMSGLSSILGQIGISGGGGGGYNYEKILTIARSNKIMAEVLFDTLTINSNKDIIANHIIDIYELNEKWEKDSILKKFKFTRLPDFDYSGNEKYNLAELTALKSLIGLMKGNPEDPAALHLLDQSFNEESSILKISSQTLNEELSLSLVNSCYDKVSKFYITQSVGNQQNNFNHLTEKADSIYNLLTYNENYLANQRDYKGFVLNKQRLPQAQSMRRIEMYSILYGEIIKQKETAAFLLANETPFFQVLDKPMKPLYPIKDGTILNLIIGGVLGVFLGITFFLAQYLFQEINQN